MSRCLQVSLLLYIFVQLYDVADLELVKIFEHHTAFVASPDLGDVLFNLLQGIKLACLE